MYAITAQGKAGAQRFVQVVRDFDEAGIGIDDIGLRRPTLDDVFLALTGHAAEPPPAGGEDAAPVPAGREARRSARRPPISPRSPAPGGQ